jgi:predicted DNA-binding protein (MmcQ/YjbR family)
MNKTHWNTVDAEGLPSELLLKLIRHSYDLVKQKKSRAK